MAQTIGASAPLPPPPVVRAPLAARPDPADQQRIDAALHQLRGTESGREVSEFLAAQRVDLRVLPDDDFRRRYPGAGAVYDPKTNEISMPRRLLDSSSLATTLAHEGRHAMDFADQPHWLAQSAKLVGGTAIDSARAALRLDNPITGWLDSLTARQNEYEVSAYHLQAKVAHELGRNESHWGLGQAPDGTPLPLDEVRSRIAKEPLYRMDPTRRLILGAGLGLATTSFAAIGAQTLAGKLAPNSYLARAGWPIYAVGGAAAAAFVVNDQLRARRLETEHPR